MFSSIICLWSSSFCFLDLFKAMLTFSSSAFKLCFFSDRVINALSICPFFLFSSSWNSIYDFSFCFWSSMSLSLFFRLFFLSKIFLISQILSSSFDPPSFIFVLIIEGWLCACCSKSKIWCSLIIEFTCSLNSGIVFLKSSRSLRLFSFFLLK